MTIHADQAETARTEAFAAIRDGNDRFRKSFGADFTTPGQVLMSAGVDAKDIAFRQAAMCALIAYDGFTPETDAHGAHDFGVLSVEGARVRDRAPEVPLGPRPPSTPSRRAPLSLRPDAGPAVSSRALCPAAAWSRGTIRLGPSGSGSLAQKNTGDPRSGSKPRCGQGQGSTREGTSPRALTPALKIPFLPVRPADPRGRVKSAIRACGAKLPQFPPSAAPPPEMAAFTPPARQTPAALKGGLGVASPDPVARARGSGCALPRSAPPKTRGFRTVQTGGGAAHRRKGARDPAAIATKETIMMFNRYMRGMSNGGIATGEALTNAELQARVPSIFAAEAHESRSARFTPVPTIQVLDGLRAEGFEPFYAQQARSRIEGKAAFTKHMVRLRHRGLTNGEDAAFEIILVNANDGTSSYQMIPGFFRFVCANGLMAGETFNEVKVRHSGDAVSEVIEGAYTVLEEAPRITEAISRFKGIVLEDPERLALAEAAHMLRFPKAHEAQPTPAPVQADALALPRRREDRATDLWTAFNVVQENVIRGGQRGMVRTDRGYKRRTVREVSGIDQGKALNRALWTLTERMAELKAG